MRTIVALLVLSFLLTACPTEPELVLVTFDSQGGSAVSSQTIAKGSLVAEPAAPIKEGCIISGWFTDPTDGVAWNFNTPVAGNITLYAHWVTLHTVSFDSQAGSVVPSQEVADQNSATVPESPTRMGYRFDGWFTESENGEAWDFEAPISMDLTLYAHWTQVYTVTFDSQGGSAVATQLVEPDQQATDPGDLGKTGATFQGWYTASTGGALWDFSSSVTQDTKLYAQWLYTLQYASASTEEGTVAGELSQQVRHGGSGTLVEAVANDGFEFAGWSDGAVPTRTRTDRNVQASLSVTANFCPVSYTVSFDTHGGSAITSQTVERGSCPTEPEADPAKEGYRFKDWFTDAETESYFDFSAEIYDDVIVHAQWIEQFTVTFDSQGGSALSSSVVDDGTPITAPQSPTKTGHTFAGWYTGPNATGTLWPFGEELGRITDDTTLYAAWNVLSFDVTYRADDASGSVPATISHQYGSSVTVAVQGGLTKTGYTFNGWNTASDGSGISYGAGVLFIMPANEVFLYAQWTTSPQYTLVYHANGGSGVLPVGGAFVSGTNVAVQDNTGNLTKAGCYFDGWNTAADGSGISYPPRSTLIMPASGVTLYAQWAVQQYIVYLSYGNGEETGEITVDHGEPVTKPVDPTYVGHAFGGWFAEPSFVTPWDFATPITAQTTIYGKWTLNSYNLSYHANGGTGTSPADPTSYEYDQDVQVQSNTFTRAGYTFKQWNTKTDGSGTALQASDTFSMPAEDTVLYAIWTPNEYVLSYDGNGSDGGAVPAALVVNTGASVTVAAGTMTKTGHDFNSWNEAPDGLGTSRAAGASLTMPAQSVVLYARWTPVSYTITFETDGGSTIPSQSKPYGNLLDEPAVPTKESATFGGWQRANGVLWNFSSDTVRSNETLTARWVVDQHLVQFDSQGGSAIDSVLVNDGTAVAEPADPTRIGYDFSGCWFTASVGGTEWIFSNAVNSSMTLYARWTRKSFTVVFDSLGGTTVSDQSINFEEHVLKPADPTKNPYDFAGWFADEALGDAWNFEGDVVLGATTLYAKWVLPVTSPLAVFAGDSHTLFVDSSGKVFVFGENDYGQLGRGDSFDVSSAVETLRGTSSFAAVSVAAGLGHTLIVDQDGSLWVSGMNRYYGQLGAGLDPATDSDQNTFINVPLEGDAIGVAAGFIHSVVLLENGDLLGAGFNGSRQLAISDTTPQDTFVKIASDVTDVWAGGYDTFFKKRDGTLWGTGYNRYGQLGTGTTGEYSDGAIPIVYASTNTPVRDVRQVAVGGGHVLFLLEDGRVYASGLNSSGQLGIGSTADSAQLKYVTDGVEFVAAGDHHSALVKRDGSLWVFGNNLFGQLGDGTKTNRTSPTRITALGNNVYRVATGYGHTVVMLHDMSILGTGLNSSGQLGLADTNNRLVFTEAAD